LHVGEAALAGGSTDLRRRHPRRLPLRGRLAAPPALVGARDLADDGRVAPEHEAGGGADDADAPLEQRDQAIALVERGIGVGALDRTARAQLADELLRLVDERDVEPAEAVERPRGPTGGPSTARPVRAP